MSDEQPQETLLHERTFDPDSTEGKVAAVIKTCYAPEIPVDIFELGLIYTIDVADGPAEDEKEVNVTMTLTSPACPVAGTLPPEVQQKIQATVPEVGECRVEVVWDPPWNLDMMSEAAKLQLGMM